MLVTVDNVAQLHQRLYQTEYGVLMDAAPVQSVRGRFDYLATLFSDPVAFSYISELLEDTPPPCVSFWLTCSPNAISRDDITPAAIHLWLRACAVAAEQREIAQYENRQYENRQYENRQCEEST